MLARVQARVSAAALLLLLAACGSDSTGVRNGSSGGSTRVLLSDDPFPYDRLARVDLYVVSIQASLTSDTGAGGGGGGNFVTLAQPNRRFDVLALQNGTTAELGSVKLPAGAITAVRMVIDTDSSSITLKDGRVLTGGSRPGIQWQSSAGRPALNALVQEQLIVPDTGAVIVIDYDVGQAFIPLQVLDPASTDSSFVFSPVLRAVDAARTGSIGGVVRSASGQPVRDASLTLYLGRAGTPENTWPSLATGKTDADGAFTLSFVTRSSYWQNTGWSGATYFVAVDPPSSSGLGRTVVPAGTVEILQRTDLGTIILPVSVLAAVH